VLAKKAYASMCAYYKDKGRCAHSHYASQCPKTCGRCTKASNAGCADNVSWSRPYTHRTYKRKKYASYCAWMKESGRCPSRPHTGRVYEKKTFKSLCAYYKDRGQCVHHSTRTRCAKTCTGAGVDDHNYLRPHTAVVPVVEKSKAFKSQCAYVKSIGQCRSSHWKSRCKRTCGSCKVMRSSAAAGQARDLGAGLRGGTTEQQQEGNGAGTPKTNKEKKRKKKKNTKKKAVKKKKKKRKQCKWKRWREYRFWEWTLRMVEVKWKPKFETRQYPCSKLPAQMVMSAVV